jgi:hypothetical protein
MFEYCVACKRRRQLTRLNNNDASCGLIDERYEIVLYVTYTAPVCRRMRVDGDAHEAPRGNRNSKLHYTASLPVIRSIPSLSSKGKWGA